MGAVFSFLYGAVHLDVSFESGKGDYAKLSCEPGHHIKDANLSSKLSRTSLQMFSLCFR